MRISLIIVACSLFLFSFFAHGQVQNKAYGILLSALLSHTVNEISVEDIKTLNDSAVYLDARESREYEVSHLTNARHVGYDNFDIESLKDIPKESKIIVYCSVGYRSEKVAEKLVAAGYEDVYNLYGGIFEWTNQGLKVRNKEGVT